MDEHLFASRPVIVTGMHRSGTRLVARLLERMGVFMGADQQGDSESLTFLRINEAIFHQCGTFWSEPMPVHVLLAQPENVQRIAGQVRDALAPELARYLGQGGADVAARPFGWKDPRNTFTLPVWRRLFPNARVLHVVRHGVDVAASLARRQRELCRAASGESVPSPLAVFEDHAVGVLSSRRGWTLPEALTMWEEYVEKARMALVDAPENGLEVRFEALLERPDDVVPGIARFCDGRAPARGDALWPSFDPRRAYAYRRDPELVAFAEGVGDVLRRYGYAP